MPAAPSSLVLSVGAQNHPGRTRTENQDRISRAATPFGELFIVADGVGGQGGGGEAAQAVVDGLTDYLKSHGGAPLTQVLEDAVRTTSAELCLRGKSSGTSGSMSSTVVLALIQGGHATIAHVGDSRAYLVRDGRLRLLTRDDSVVERLVSRGVLSQTEAREHPDASVLTQAIGQRAAVTLNVTEIQLTPSDALLLCSDGLWAYADHAELEAIAADKSLSAEAVADALLSLALQEGGGDNISLQLIRFDAARRFTRLPVRWWGQRPVVLVSVGLLAAGLMVALAGLAAWNVRHPLTVPHPGLQVDGLDPNAVFGPPSVDAQPANRAPTAVQAPAKSLVILVRSDDSPSPAWESKIRNLPTIEAREQKGSAGCLALRTDRAVLAHTPASAAIARSLADQAGLKSADSIEVTPEKLASCGSAGLVVLPARPQSIQSRVKGAAQKIGDQIKSGIAPGKK